MKKKIASQSAFFNSRVLIGLAFCAIGVLIALLAFALYPGGNAFAKQNQTSASAPPATQQPLSAGAVQLAIDEDILSANTQRPTVVTPPNPEVPSAIFLVNTTADTQDATPGDGICADSGGFCSLRAAITENNALGGGNTITLPAGTYTETLVAASEDNNAGGDFDIRAAVTINGAGAATTIIQAAAAPATAPNERVFHITLSGTAGSVGTVNISDVTIRNGYITAPTAPSTSGAGAGIRIDVTSTVTFTNVIITGNRLSEPNNSFGGGLIVRGQGPGGAVALANPNITLTGCTISDNISSSTGAGVNAFAGGVYNQDGIVTLNNCTVTGNTASSFHGAIRTLSSSQTATTNITNCTISGNTAQGVNGGANVGQGGGVANLVAATFASTTMVTSSTISGNTAIGVGAACSTGCSVGGGVINTDSGVTGAAIFSFLNSTISGNTSEVAGGIYSNGPAATMNLDYTTVAANNATSAASGIGGGLLQDVTAGGVTNLKDSVVGDNRATTTGPDINGTITSGGYNHVENTSSGTFTTTTGDVTGSDAGLSPLQNDGGPTFTHMPSAVSPVLNTIPNGTAGCGTTVLVDQRGFGHPRPTGGACEKGSVERQPNDATPTPAPSGTPSPTPTATSSATATATATASPTPTTPPPTATPAVTPSPTATPCVILYDQNDNAGTSAINSQMFAPADAAFDNQAADDFVVPAGQSWIVQKVVVSGVYFNGTGPAPSFNVYFYNNAGGLPGTQIGSTQTNVPYSCVGACDATAVSVNTMYLPSSVILGPGTYWVSVQASMDFNAGGQWGWEDRTVQSNSAAAWQNPGGGFATACNSWGARGATCLIDNGVPDQMFQILGCLVAPTPTPTPASIAGNVTYCSNPTLPAVPGVLMTLTPGGTTSTDGSGNYSFLNLVAGTNYTVTPTKTALAPGASGISTVDVIAIQKHFLQVGAPLTGCRLQAADCAAPVGVSTVDVLATQKFFLGFATGIGNVGKYSFNPVSIAYTPLTGILTGQNYGAFVFGDVVGGFVHRPEGGGGTDIGTSEVASSVAAVSLPEVTADKGNIIAAIKTSEIDAKSNLVGFQGDFTFDERVVTFDSQPVQNAGITGTNWNVSGHVLDGPGPIRTLRVSAYSNDLRPLSGSGTLFELRMTRVSQGTGGTPLTWAAPPNQFIFIDLDLNTQSAGKAAPGSIAISQPK